MKLFAFIKREKGETAKLYRVETTQKLTRGQLIAKMSLLSEKQRRIESAKTESAKTSRRGPRDRTKRSEDPPSRLIGAGACCSMTTLIAC